MESFQVLIGHGDLARARQFARNYLEAQKACYGEDADEIGRWRGRIIQPMTYREEHFSEKWWNPMDRILSG
ncbi:hypothetical protein L207DRAFT_62281 [Hyaloscypha variabilis F]|jgi:hypothetical protein|uniref:Uncharacterized protein n=1 Tax=Hyaloscypha variabilis (strain UAMH 11265 / GT02V1 / F) TaxID=1149755 RepID=A0A2J6RI09_HYAVF|nr:hypothetical protein L207DRAFT_62281 [Hyaloscypha variabilis F]